MRRVFGIPIGPRETTNGWRIQPHKNTKQEGVAATAKISLNTIKRRMSLMLDDCTDLDAERVQYRIQNASNATDLWMARSDAYQIIARKHGQAEASIRINDLISSFQELLPAKQLVRI